MLSGTNESGPSDFNAIKREKQNGPPVSGINLFPPVERKVAENESKEDISDNKKSMPSLSFRGISRDVSFSKGDRCFHDSCQPSTGFADTQPKTFEECGSLTPKKSFPFLRYKEDNLFEKKNMKINDIEHPRSFHSSIAQAQAQMFNEQCKKYCQANNGFSMIHENGNEVQFCVNKVPDQWPNYNSFVHQGIFPSSGLHNSNTTGSRTISYPLVSIFSTNLTPQSFTYYCTQANIDIIKRLKILKTLVNERSMSRRISRRRNRKLFEIEIELKMLLSISEDLLNIFKSLKCTKEHLRKVDTQ